MNTLQEQLIIQTEHVTPVQAVGSRQQHQQQLQISTAAHASTSREKLTTTASQSKLQQTSDIRQVIAYYQLHGGHYTVGLVGTHGPP